MVDHEVKWDHGIEHSLEGNMVPTHARQPVLL
jgi:hypothetical protein